MTPAFSVRAARPEDAAVLAELFGQLGYPSTPEQVSERLARRPATDPQDIHVVEVDGRPAACVVMELERPIHRPAPQARLGLLVVDAAHRRQGLGAALLGWATDWARERGATRLVLATAQHRKDAHRFYEREGFTLSGLRYARDLT